MDTRTKNVSLEDLQNIVGEEHAREAGAEDAVDGVAPQFVAEPGSIEEISELMKLASEEGLTVSPRGSGTKMDLGNPPRHIDLIVSMVRMNEIIEHTPGDQVVRVQAGLKLRDLQEQLATADQLLGIDPPEREATLGGIVAANSSGPRRYRYGTMRDLIIGITVVLPDGTIAKAGGKVVKNVAGYDLSKLFTGSLGTLGVIATCNFRLHPKPEAARTIAVELSDTLSVERAAQAITGAQLVPSAVELHWSEGAKLLTVLIEGIQPGVEAQAETVSYLLKGFGEVRTLSDEEVEHLGPLDPPGVGEEEVAIKISAPPAEITGVLDSTLGAAGRKGVTPRITGQAGIGVTNVAFSGGDQEALVQVVEELREIWVRRGGSVVVRRAPLPVKQRLDAWGAAGDYLGLTKRVKEKFDPRGILNPGRFLGGI
ncbi:MAG TPA: FAD-binding oxidoreductase [Rubrobacteraceae bacterium]|nr:FAD-binding oxidoreductase [Rubrobacteraceae bacterium]